MAHSHNALRANSGYGIRDRSVASDQPAPFSPHPGPLPRGEGENFAARWRIKRAWWFTMGSAAVPSPTGRGSGWGGTV